MRKEAEKRAGDSQSSQSLATFLIYKLQHPWKTGVDNGEALAVGWEWAGTGSVARPRW